MTIVCQNCASWRSNQERRFICADTVRLFSLFQKIKLSLVTFKQGKVIKVAFTSIILQSFHDANGI